MIFNRTGRGAIISWYGTNGAFGMNGLQAILPLDLYILFPAGASLDHNGTIQMDSSAALSGGVAPTVRVPLSRETAARAMAGEDVQLTYAMSWLKGDHLPATASAQATPTPRAAERTSVALAAIMVTAGLLAKRK